MRIAIPVPTTSDLAYNRRSWPAYAEAIRRAGGEPVACELNGSGAATHLLAESCDGVLLPGSPADVDPQLYGAERHPSTAPADSAREATDFLLLAHAAATGKPLLGICYGLQSMNVFHGGSLLQDLSPLPVNHEAGGQVAVAHAVLVAPMSVLASTLAPDEASPRGEFLHLPVNSSHHQAVAAPGNGLRIVARCPEDGVIEALELGRAELFHVEQLGFLMGEQVPGAPVNGGPGASSADASTPGSEAERFLLGVQWHPERSYDISATSRALFARLVAEARRRAGPPPALHSANSK